MVAQKKGRGAKAQPAKAKAAPPAAVEEPAPQETEAAEEVENNGDAEPAENTEGAAGAEGGNGEPAGDQSKENADESKEEKKEEEKVESGKLLVENLPSSYLFDYQEKLKELFSKHGEVVGVKRGPIIVTELTTTPTLSAIVEFKNKDSLEKALSEEGTVLDGSPITVVVESRSETTVLVGVPYEASTEYVKLLFAQCGEITHIHEFSKTKYKILRVTFLEKESAERALKLDRELRVNGFLVTVSRYRDDDDQKMHNTNTNKNKRSHGQQPQRPNQNTNTPANTNNSQRNNSFRSRGGAGFSPRGGNFRGGRGGRGFGGGRGFARGFAPPAAYLPPQAYMPRPQGQFMNDGQRPNKRLRQM